MDDLKKDLALRVFRTFGRFSKLNWNQSPVNGLRVSELFTLFSIKQLINDPNSSSKVTCISKMLNVAPPMVTQQVTSLEQKGYVERSANKDDRRSVEIILTEKGEQVVEAAKNEYYKCFEGLVDYLGAQKSGQLIELLNMVFNYFKGIEENNNKGETNT